MDNYEENVLCDVIPMKFGHIMLGRPRQYDHKSIHDDYPYKIIFTHKEST